MFHARLIQLLKQIDVIIKPAKLFEQNHKSFTWIRISIVFALCSVWFWMQLDSQHQPFNTDTYSKCFVSLWLIRLKYHDQIIEQGIQATHLLLSISFKLLIISINSLTVHTVERWLATWTQTMHYFILLIFKCLFNSKFEMRWFIIRSILWIPFNNNWNCDKSAMWIEATK